LRSLTPGGQEKRGEIEPEDPSTNLIVQLGLVTEDLNPRYDAIPGTPLRTSSAG
jgi:hypothetical protein